MDVSIIIVNYNVKFFLEQCLFSVQKAIKNLQAEVFVIDNNSSDNSLAYLQPKFPVFQFIQNKENVGFGKANNQGFSLAKGKYILMLNPDTIVAEDSIEKCIAFFNETPHCGAIGIKMIDGVGNFLPESKRAFPSILTSFFKLVGLARIFPKSKLFNKYALGHLSPNQNHEVDVLAGAFIMLKKDVLQQINGFDEDFFMYGEDIDLSYRIQQAGYKNYYFAESSIIHFKGESSKRGNLNYVKMFYEAMSIFVNKHYKSGTATLFNILIKLAIWARAFVSLIVGFLNRWGMVLVDALVIFATIWLVKNYWIEYIRSGSGFKPGLTDVIIPSFTLLFVFTAALSGIYDNLYKPSKALIASATSTIVLLAAYSLLPEEYRFSRGIILAGGIAAGLMITLVRWVLIMLNWIKPNDTEEKKFKRTVIVGSLQEYEVVSKMMQQAGVDERILGRIKTDDTNQNCIGDFANIKSLLTHLNVREVIFCEGTISNKTIIQNLIHLPKNISYRFFEKNSNSIVGSDNKTTTGETLTADGYYLLHQPYQKRMKRLTDMAIATLFIISFPLHILLSKKCFILLKNSFLVVSGKKTWVGYIIPEKKLPLLPTCVITHFGLPFNALHPLNNESLHQLDAVYAKNFDWMQDIKIIFKNYRRLSS